MSLQSFFSPKSVAVVGVSENLNKLGSIIFQNIIDSGFEGDLYGINPKLSDQKLLGKECVDSVSSVTEALDLVIIVVPGKYTGPVVDDCVKNKTKNIIIISAGFGEVGNIELEQSIAQKCTDNNINLLGPNCLGVIFPHVGLNASFADGNPLPGKICFVSQSGAFCTAMLDWAAEKNIGFSHFVSLGNKAGISEVEILQTLMDDDQVDMFAFYLESLAHGPEFLEAIKKCKKPIVILEPGKSTKAAEAASSHTGSLAPNSRVLQQAYRQAGAIEVFSMEALFGLLEMLTCHAHKRFGKNLAVVTNAGGVGVLTTDLSEDNHLNLLTFSDETQGKLKEKLPAEANTKNPVDIIGDARADRYQAALEILVEDPEIDQILVLLTPQRTTEVVETAQIIGQISQKTDKNIVTSFIGGVRTKTALPILQKFKVPHFNFPVDATQVMGLLANKVQSAESNFTVSQCRSDQIENIILKSQEAGLKSLAQSEVNKILAHYGFDSPGNQNFVDKQSGLEFAESFFPDPVVMKISSPSALHKTDLKGVVLNVDSVLKFEEVWEALNAAMSAADINDGSIQVQEQIPSGTEIILGVNQDPNFGPVMLFGSGGIYTEVFADTAVQILPTQDFNGLINDTKVGKILHGVRGENPKAIDPLLKTMAKIQQLVIDYPEITSIDANPVLVTEDRAVCVDFKILL